jgi:outer membrane protein TolC
MAVAFVEVDRARNRAELGQYSPLRVSELEVDYQVARAARHLSQARQRATRSLLATALGRPGALPAEVTPPSLASLPEAVDDVDGLTAEALAGNPVLGQWRARAAEDPSVAPLAEQIELDLREAVLHLWLSHGILRVQRQLADSREQFRDLSLDYNRTLYELEVRADLGDAMSRQTAARLATLEADHKLFLLRASLNALRGRELLPPGRERKS